MKRSIPLALRGSIRWVALTWAAGLLMSLNARAADVSADASAAPSNQLQSIDVQKLNGNQLQLTLHLSAAAPEPLAFTVDKPARISLDIPNTSLALSSRRIDVGADGVDTVLAAEANGRSRVVLNLDSPMPYQTHVNGNDIVVLVGTAQVAAAAPKAAAAGPAHDNAAPAGNRAIRSIDFRRSETGAGRLIVRLSDPRTPISLKQQGQQITVDFTGAELPKNLMRRYDAQDFGTPVTGFDAERVNGDTRIVLDATGEFEPIAYQSDNEYVVEVSAHKKAASDTCRR